MAVDDPFGVRTAGDLLVTCQIIYTSESGGATLIDLVTLEPCEHGGHALPAGSPMTLGFDTGDADEDRLALERVVGAWQQSDTVLILEVVGVPNGICYRFSDGVEVLRLVLDESPPGWNGM